MSRYSPPLTDIAFLLDQVFDAKHRLAFLGADKLDSLGEVLAEAGRFAAERLAPLNAVGDQGCKFRHGAVTTPPGFAEAWRAFADGGWCGLSAPESHGGHGLPHVAQLFLDEMVASANMGFGLYAGLTRGAIEAIAAHAAPEVADHYLPPMIEGRWTGAMCLTEAQAGSDLGLIRTRAEPLTNGRFAVTGSKIFITCGEHDLAENIVHLVLARLPDAPAGAKGLSLFLVPKRLAHADNGVVCGSIEHKMGIRGAPTCVIHFEAAQGFLIGRPHEGLAAMFTMMNSERLFVGVQGYAVGEAAFQAALAYARERLQGRGADGAGPVPLTAHADVRRMLMQARVAVEGSRALAAWIGLELDRSQHHPDTAERADAAQWVALLTPIFKASATDLGLEAAITAQQVFGGHGYVREWPAEQHVRDVRITSIYEGTNGIQALDLVGRKLPLVAKLVALADAEAGGAGPLAEAARALQSAAAQLATSRADAAAVCTDFLKLAALVAHGLLWARMRRAAGRHPDPAFRQAKEAAARFFFGRVLAEAGCLQARIATADAIPSERELG